MVFVYLTGMLMIVLIFFIRYFYVSQLIYIKQERKLFKNTLLLSTVESWSSNMAASVGNTCCYD